MPKVIFHPDGAQIEVDSNTKLLLAAKKANVDIRFGCASCRCGTCGVKVDKPGNLTEMTPPEKQLLERMNLVTDGTVRLACKARIIEGDCKVDLNFQDTYSPDDFDVS